MGPITNISSTWRIWVNSTVSPYQNSAQFCWEKKLLIPDWVAEVTFDGHGELEMKVLGHPEPGHRVVDGHRLVGELVHDQGHHSHRSCVHGEGPEIFITGWRFRFSLNFCDALGLCSIKRSLERLLQKKHIQSPSLCRIDTFQKANKNLHIKISRLLAKQWVGSLKKNPFSTADMWQCRLKDKR